MSEIPDSTEPTTAAPSAGTHASSDRLRLRIEQLAWKRKDNQKRLSGVQRELDEVKQLLELAPDVSAALQTLGAELFEQDLRLLEDKMTIAIQEVLKQPVRFRATAGFKNNMATVEFHIERDGNEEDVKRGQGGSVQNILSVGLRMFALTMLEPDRHRRFLMLDEQDCWLQPELVPHLVKIVHQAGRELGYQVIMVSHHDLKLFDSFADRIYRFQPKGNAVLAECINPGASETDTATSDGGHQPQE